MQLKVKNLLALAQQLQKQGMTLSEIKELPIYIGNDDELNGIHTAWYAQLVDTASDNEDDMYMIEMINEDHHNTKLTDKAILIS